MRRYDPIHGLLGLVLVMMLVANLDGAVPQVLDWIGWAKLGFARAEHGFLLLAGLAVGLAARTETGLARRLMLGAYAWQLALVGGLLALMLLAAPAGWSDLAGPLERRPAANGIMAALLLYQPAFMAVLPTLVLFLAFAPLMLRAILGGRAAVVLAVSAGLWVQAQTGMDGMLGAVVGDAMRGLLPGAVARADMNPLAWQLLPVLGFWLGVRAEQGRLDPTAWARVGGRPLVLACLGFTALMLAMKLAYESALFGSAFNAGFAQRLDDTHLHAPGLAGFAAIAFLAAWLLTEGRARGAMPVRLAGQLLHAVATLPWLTLLGRNWLPVYAAQVVLVYAVEHAAEVAGPFGFVQRLAIGVGAILLMTLPAWLRDRSQRENTAAPAPVVTRPAEG
ncbi:MAG TPA: OpgC domain-containing protein [Azospirillaceae bacterium]|nr:OpgC domain-containing protein [Azospirillaceae bacterium]